MAEPATEEPASAAHSVVQTSPVAEAAAPAPAQRRSTSWLRNLSRPNLAILVLLYITALHLIGLYIFTQGFLLTRLTIPHSSPAYSSANSPPVPRTHSKAVVLIIDALRTDFISPFHPAPASPHHHGVLSLPAELTASNPSHSLMFNAFSDPPTATMQRIKGITTGSLPTFIDISSNFASTAIEEDSLISQLVQAGKRVGFMGDDTWVNLFPSSFNLSHPYDSFNVEDLHTVDNGVIEHIFPYLAPVNQSQWDVLIGHFLGVDHVGHRVGPHRDTMRVKLEQMDQVLRKVVEMIDEDTLLVLLGDHGMDDKGNHGGDSDLETASALWLYSKGAPLRNSQAVDRKLADSWPIYTFPGATQALRHVNQIDLVPTLALMLGIPIPYNNLGSIIPEPFSQDLTTLEAATRANAEQIQRYLGAYGDGVVLNALNSAWIKAQSAAETVEGFLPESIPISTEKPVGGKIDWLRRGKAGVSTVPKPKSAASDSVIELEASQAQYQSIVTHRHYALEALRHLRALWAQFSLPLILIGSLILGLSALALVALYVGVRNNGTTWDVYARLALETAVAASGVAGSVAGTFAGIYTAKPDVAIKTFIVVAALASEVVLIFPLFVKISVPNTFSINRYIGPILLIAHSVSFASNSFIMWEDRVVLFLLTTIPAVYMIKALSAPTADMRIKIIFLSIAYAIIIRLIGTITICREEQQPYCRVTFFSGLTPTAPRWVLIAIIPLALQIPRAIGLTLVRSKSLAGPAPFFLGMIWRWVLVANAVYWVLEYLEHSDHLNPARIPMVTLIKLWIARCSAGVTLGAMPYVWWTSPLCISVERKVDQAGGEPEVTVFGFANAFGSTYILFFLIPFAFTHLVTQPTGQIVLSGLLVALLAYLEQVDTKRDAIILQTSFASASASFGQPGAFDPSQDTQLQTIVRPTFTDVVPLVLMGFVGFFATGHQAVITSIQWKAAFVGFESVVYPFSPLLVIVNTWGAFFLSAIAIPLLALWNISPRPRSSLPILAHTLQLCLAFLVYHTVVTFSSAITAAWLRRHLMVWKVFAPRFMLAGVTLLVVDLGVMVALGLGTRITAWKVKRTFGCESI
ncbi:phosphatidylinositol glycan, class O [Kwoniella heveanensis CBS 569]|nr:phosphatidylinositol glycan, class O [Kwoniella heveanensis CBS 569]